VPAEQDRPQAGPVGNVNSGLPEPLFCGRLTVMPYYSGRTLGCGGVLARAVVIMMLGVVGLICFANRSWFAAKAIDTIYGQRSAIHLGRAFRPGATAVEDGVRQTAVSIAGRPYVRVTSPTAAWRRDHRDAVCERHVCTAAATPRRSASGRTVGIGTALGVILAAIVFWLVIMDDPYDRLHMMRFR
jgi:hypothetical protein